MQVTNNIERKCMINWLRSIFNHEIKVRVVFDIKESYGTIYQHAKNMTDDDYREIGQVGSKLFHSIDKYITNAKKEHTKTN